MERPVALRPSSSGPNPGAVVAWAEVRWSLATLRFLGEAANILFIGQPPEVLDSRVGEGRPEDHQRGSRSRRRATGSLVVSPRRAGPARPGPLPRPNAAVPDRRGRGQAGRAPAAAQA